MLITLNNVLSVFGIFLILKDYVYNSLISDNLIEEKHGNDTRQDIKELSSLSRETKFSITDLPRGIAAVKDKNYYVLDVSNMLPLENVQIEKLYKFNEYIKNNEDIELYSVSNDSVFIAKDNLPISFFSNFDSFILENKQFQRVGLIFLNDKYLDNMGIKLSEGSFHKQKSEYESVVLGDEYKGLFNINDIIPYNYSEVNGELHLIQMRICK